MTRSRILLLAIFLGMLAVDQAVKAWVRGAIPVGGSIGGKPWPGVFEITLTYNKGIAFGMFQGAGVLMAPIAILMGGAAIWHSWKHPQESKWMHIAMGLVASGAVGNLIDRVWLGQVTDMFFFRLINFPVFNVADSCITIATIILIVVWGWVGKPKQPAPAE